MPNEYNLPAQEPMFPQVEPRASYWFRCLNLCSITFEDTKKIDEIVEPYKTDEALLKKDIEMLKDFYERRNEPYPQENLSIFLRDERFTRQPPPGAVVSRPQPGRPLIATGLELATLFENETPTLWHNHVLNVFLASESEGGLGFGERLSPPLQGLMWAALDLAISSALMTVWHYKWLATKYKEDDAGKPGDQPPPNMPDLTIARRQRPWEFDNSLPVLFDLEVMRDRSGILFREMPKAAPQPTPGTPRHPAYASGHSTYSGAGSTILACFFPDYREEFEKLAVNIGEARLWGGVHWTDDDTQGRAIGRRVGELIIRQLNDSGIYGTLAPPDFSRHPATSNTVSAANLEKAADEFAENCGKSDGDFCDGLPPSGSENVFQNRQG